MQILLISIFAVASLSIFPTKTFGTATTEIDQEQPHALPLSAGPVQASALASPAAAQLPTSIGEIWQEDDREVLIRNERGTKNSSNGGTGKKEKVKKIKNSNHIKTTAASNHGSGSTSTTPNSSSGSTKNASKFFFPYFFLNYNNTY